MPKYLFEVRYTAEGAKGLLQDGGAKRRAAVESTLQKVGGKMEAFYFAFGKYDVYLIADLPDAATASALSLAVSASGAAAIRTTVLLDPREIDAAKRKGVAYKAPGKK